MENAKDISLEAFKMLVPHLRGALWWIRNDLLKERQRQFNQKDDRVGHPGMSLLDKEPEGRNDPVPMLFGTTLKERYCMRKAIVVKGMTAGDREHRTIFGTIVEPGIYKASEMLDAVKARSNAVKADKKRNILHREAWHEFARMLPNWDKPMVDADEMKQVEAFCRRHKL